MVLPQVSSQARTGAQQEALQALQGLSGDGDSSVREAVADALADCLYFESFCAPALEDLCRVLAAGAGSLPLEYYGCEACCAEQIKHLQPYAKEKLSVVRERQVVLQLCFMIQLY